MTTPDPEQEETRTVTRTDVVATVFYVVGSIWFIVDLVKGVS